MTPQEAKYMRLIGASGRVWLITRAMQSHIASPLVERDVGGIVIDGQHFTRSDYCEAYNDTLTHVCRERAASEHVCGQHGDGHHYVTCRACNIGAPGASKDRSNVMVDGASFTLA